MERDTFTTLVPRVKSFTNQYVTKSAYDSDEAKITSLALLVFNSDGNLVHLAEDTDEGGVSSIMLNKSLLNSPEQREKLTSATVVMIANISLDNISKADGTTLKTDSNLTLGDMEDYTAHFTEAQTVVTSIPTDFSGFPMIGGKTNVNLNATSTQQPAVEVGMKILYAKVNFSIAVEAGTENTGTGMSFTLNGYTVNNVSKATSLAIPDEAGEPVKDFLGNVADATVKATADEATASTDYAYTTSDATAAASGTTTLDNNPVTFTFYVAESRYNHNSDLKGIYPSDNWLTSSETEDVKNYDAATDRDKLNGVKCFYDDLIQQYKPKLAAATTGTPRAGLATFVTLNGTYTDYRGTAWNVNYKVYLGKDNAQNFHVDRNSSYTNYITIKGIRNNDSYGDDKGNVWVDHRVDVSTNDPSGNVTITRETLIDSHVEVRPLRVSWEGDKYAGVRVYLPTKADETLVDWIGIERFTGENCQEATTYCYQGGKSIGKRKYFTNALIDELQVKEGEFGVREDDSGRKYVYLLNDECAWIYFDENPTTAARSANIDLEFYIGSDSAGTERYTVTQHGLQEIGGYLIESYEEYLHTYDSEDKYNLSTNPVDYTQQGLLWGDSKKYSSEIIVVANEALYYLAGENRYDFFHKSDQPQGDTYYSYVNDVKIPTGAGLGTNATGAGTGIDFTNRGSAKFGTKVIDMGTEPESAYQYCLSKNKFTVDEEGNVSMIINWYLPDAYEMQTILSAGDDADEFRSEALYWSSQPAFDGIYTTNLGIANEVTTKARAVSKSSGIVDANRSVRNRIRCLYSSSGVSLGTEDMKDRVPDGIGGNYTFVMKAFTDKNKTGKGFFNYMIDGAEIKEDSTTDEYDYDDFSYPFPTFANPGSEFGYFDNVTDANGATIVGFDKNPVDQNNWTVGTYSNILGQPETATGYYSTLYTFPGLTPYTLEKHDRGNFYAPTNTPKTDRKIVSDINSIQLSPTLPDTNLNSLDHVLGGDMLNISFSNKDNTVNSPYFKYYEHKGSTVETTTRYWSITYPQDTYEGTPDEENVSHEDTGTGSDTARSKDNARKNSFSEAYENAKTAAKSALDEYITQNYPGYQEVQGSVSYTPLTWESTEGVRYYNEYGWGIYYCSCDVTVTCTMLISKPSIVTYYGAPVAGWDAETTSTETINRIDTDELRMHCGNSFTISLNGEYANTHEITKVKVHYSGNNFVGEGGTFNTDKYYTRFVDSSISMSQSSTIPWGGSAETLQLPGMDYSDDETSGTGTHQWAGTGRQSITLVLRDYFVYNNLGTQSYTYTYDTAKTDLNKYIIIDRIEVKCTPKSTE